jgi:hypothetical protein
MRQAQIKRNVAVVTANYTKSKEAAKATIRYIQHRTGKAGARVNRTLFGLDGALERNVAYRMIDRADKGSIFYRIIISPDPETEDTRQDLSLRDVTEQTMHALGTHIHQPIAWVAAIHADHTQIRHVHCLAVVTGRIPARDFRALPRVLIQQATHESQAQRRHLDQAREARLKEREEAAWER